MASQGPRQPDKSARRGSNPILRAVEEAQRRSWRRFLPRLENTDAPSWRLWLVIIVPLLIGAFFAPGLFAKPVAYPDSLLGQTAVSDVRSPGDYNIEDTVSTESKRREAERAVNPIYEAHLRLTADIQRRVDVAFKKMQSLIVDFIIARVVVPDELAQKAPKTAAKNAQKPPTPPNADPAVYEAEKRKERLEQATANIDAYFSRITKDDDLNDELKTLVLSARAEFNRDLQAVLSEEDFLDLYSYYFSAEMNEALKKLVSEVMTRRIVVEKELMEKSQNGEIIIIPAGEPLSKASEYQLRDLNSILDYRKVREVLWHYTAYLSDLGERQRGVLLRLAEKLISPNLTYNRELTQSRRNAAREAIRPVIIPVRKGEMIIREHERYEERHLALLRGIETEIMLVSPVIAWLGYAGFFLLMILAFHHFGQRNIRKYNPEPKDLFLFSLLVLLFLFLLKGVGVVASALEASFPKLGPEIYYLAIPVAAGAAMLRIVINSETAYLFAAFIAVLFGMQANLSFFGFVYALVTGLIAADAVGKCEARATLFFAGIKAAVVGVLLVATHLLIGGRLSGSNALPYLVAAACSGLATGIVLTGMTPVIEFLFNYTTDIKLLELSNLNHPLLKKLIVQAPGTYHHSILVGSLVENAASSIHANPLLARVAAYYHDIGKVKTPQYFVENQSDGPNPHDSLSPSMSVLILHSHVKEGVELARRYNLGRKITDIIAQHHGTNLIRYFYHKAKEQKAEGGKLSDSERDFRYPGPKPQTREAGLVMLADSVEAAVRSLDDPTPERVQLLVQKVINSIFRDGQLNECELTLKGLHEIARSFTQVLIGIYHNRPNYPDTPSNKEKAANGRPAAQSAKKATDTITDIEAEDDEDIKRLGLL